MKKLVIVGAGGYGRAVYDIAIRMPSINAEFVIKGFIDDTLDALKGYPNYPPILSTIKEYKAETDDVFVCAIGNIKYKRPIIDYLKQKGCEFFSVIHPTAGIGTNTMIGKGCIIGKNSMIDCDVHIEDNVAIQANVVIGHDSIIGEGSVIDCFSFTGGFSKLGKDVTVHTSSIIIPSICIENNVTVNAGSVVIRPVKEGKTVMGNPAKEIIIPRLV